MLTGAHCMNSVPMEELGVLIGDHNLYTISTSQKFVKVKEKVNISKSISPPKFITVSVQVIHPDYNMRGNMSSPLNNDIGLLRLEFPLIFTSQISPLCLPALGETGFGGSAYGSGNTSMLDTTGLNIVGQNATVLGWGMINDAGDFADSLRGVEVEVLPNQDCNVLYGIMTENMMCTSGDNGRGTCFGDSGGPAIVRQPDGAYVQVDQTECFSFTLTPCLSFCSRLGFSRSARQPAASRATPAARSSSTSILTGSNPSLGSHSVPARADQDVCF